MEVGNGSALLWSISSALKYSTGAGYIAILIQVRPVQFIPFDAILTSCSGNIIIRPHPSRPSTAQLVLLDHGLYVRLTEEFRTQYAVLWKALLTVDQDTIVSVTSSWGFGAPDLFASATLLRPIRFGKNKAKTDQEVVKPPEQLSNYELGVRMKAQLKSFLTDTDKMPKELVFIARNMRIVQGMSIL
jgi:aarF domain-containing kinase